MALVKIQTSNDNGTLNIQPVQSQYNVNPFTDRYRMRQKELHYFRSE